MISGKKKIWLLLKFGKFIATFLLCYQIILVTISYLNYETVIDMKAIAGEKQRPTFTFCLKSKNEFRAGNYTLKGKNSVVFDHPIGCSDVYVNDDKYLDVNCSQVTRIVESVTPFSGRCFSYLSQLLDENLSPNIKGFKFIIPNSLNMYALVHQSRTLPHFFNDEIDIEKSSFNQIDYSSINTKLMPFPYETDCSHYKHEEKSEIRFKSREDCIVKHLERREFIKCGCNKRWSCRGLDTANYTNLCPKSVKCHLDSESKEKLSENICKKDCLNHYFFNIISSAQWYYNFRKLKISQLMPYKSDKYEITFNYLAKMNFVEYLCSVGGLISMWFGWSFYDLALLFVTESKKILIHLFGIKLFFIIFKFKKFI
jgi:hypothetical protein